MNLFIPLFSVAQFDVCRSCHCEGVERTKVYCEGGATEATSLFCRQGDCFAYSIRLAMTLVGEDRSQ